MLRVITSHTIEAIFQVMTVAVNYHKGQKQLEIIALHLKSTSTRPNICAKEYLKKLSNAFPGNQVGLMKPILPLMFIQQDKKSLEESTSPKETESMKFSGK